MSLLLPPLPPTFEAALRDVTARTQHARVSAAERLATPEASRKDAALGGLLALAADQSAEVRQAALRSLRELVDQRALDCFIERLGDADALVRELACCGLGTLRGPRVEAALQKALNSPHAAVRFQAIASYFEAGRDPSMQHIAPLLQDADPKVRAHAVRHVDALGAGATETLRKALDDESVRVRLEAALALARLDDASGAAAMLEGLHDPEHLEETLDAIGALKLTAHAEAVAELAQAILKPLLVKVAAARALARLGDPRGVAVLRTVLRAFRNDGRSYAVHVAGELGLTDLTGELVSLASRPRGADLVTLTTALTALLPGDPSARNGLLILARRTDAAGELARDVLRNAR